MRRRTGRASRPDVVMRLNGTSPAPGRAVDAPESLTDETIFGRVLAGETALYELIMRRHNERLYRAARAILRNDDEAEDVLQETYVRAFRSLHQFEGRARFATWLTRIAVHEAMNRRRKRLRLVSLDRTGAERGEHELSNLISHDATPEDDAERRELAAVITRCVDALPETLRLVFILRDIQGLSVEEAAEVLDISPANVKVRLHRARRALRQRLSDTLISGSGELYPFHLSRCDRVVARVFERISVPRTD